MRLIYGAMRDKAIDEISGILFPRAQQVIVTAPQQARALAPEALRDIGGHPGLRTAPTLRDALALVEDASPDDVVFVTGSLFLVAEARRSVASLQQRIDSHLRDGFIHFAGRPAARNSRRWSCRRP